MLTFYSCTYSISRYLSTTTLPSQATRTKRFIMPIIIATLFLSFHSASAQSDNNVTNVQTCVSCPTGATCFTDEARNMTKEWGYDGYICSSSQECYGANSMNVQLPRQIPVVILLGDRLTFVPWREQDFEFQPYNLSKADFDKCNVVGTSLSPSLTGDPVVVEDRYLRPPGIKYFAVKTNNNLFTCDFGMKLEVSVRSKEPCINPNDRSTGVCSGKGQCVMLGQFFTYNMTCKCCDYYTGKYCEELNSCLRSPCQNQATCLDINAGLRDAYNCSCVPGFTGKNCEINIDDCASRPCLNGGLCVDGVNSYSCLCQPDINGDNCEIVTPNRCQPNPCENGGTCDRTVGNDGSRSNYSCTCVSGYTGRNCTERDLCEPENPCANGGTCQRTIGSDGSLGYNCTCAPGYLGTNCTERNLCEPVNPCINGGTCKRTVGSDGSPGYNCTCAPGYLGTNCTERNLCEPVNPCVNGGTCKRTVGSDGSPGYNCTCAPGYLGTNCTERNLCEPVNPCANGGTCKRTVGSDGSAGYNCTCIEGFTGKNCSEITPSSSSVPTPSSSSDIQKTAIRSTSVTVQYSTSSVPIIAITTSYDMAETTSLVSTLQLLTTPAATLPTDSLKSTGVFKPTTAIDTQLSTITPTSPSSVTSSDVGSTDTATSTPTSSPSSPITSSDVGGSDTSSLIINTTTSGITPRSTISVTTLTTTPTHTTTSITLHPSSAILDSSLGPASTPRTTISSTTHVSSTPIASSSMVMTPTAINPSATVTTTVPSTSVVVKPVRAMTCSDSPCGPGTCIDVKDYHALVNFTCQCPYKTFGPRCSRDYTPHFIRFSNNSYLVHKEIVTSPEFNKIVIAFKTNATDGLLFFSKHASYRDFFQLHIVGGKLEFRFDPGDRLAAIKSDADVSIGRKITAVITYNSRTKTATLQVDSGDVYRKVLSGDLVGINLGDKWYIGGAPPSISLGSTVGAVVTPSLVGCISDIEVNNVGIKLTDATDWYNLGECDAPCVNNPCRNGGTCTPDADDPHDYDCKCPSGYQGKSCTLISACVGDPCSGGRCIVSNSSQPQNHVCLCPYGKAGVSCEHDISISVPGFTMLHGYASYIQYATPTPGASHFDITMQFRVDDPIAWNDALLLYSSQDRYLGGGDFIALGLKDGQVLLQYNLGSGLARIRSCSLNKTQDWHTVTAGRSGPEGYVYADNCEKVRGSSEGNLQELNLYAPLFIGGVHDLSELPTYVDFKSGFRGNLYGMAIRFSNQEVWRNLSLLQTQGVSERVEAGSNIGNESYNECISQTPPCLNGGNCTRHAATYVCRCLPGWRGLYCGSRSIPCLDYNPCAFGSTCREKQGVVTCDCPLGRTGLTCSQKLNIQVPLFKESSYMEFKSPAYIRTVTSIVIKFTPKALNGLLFYTTHKIDSLRGDFISLALHNGFIQGRFDLGSGIGFGQTTQPVTINTEVTVILNRTRNSGSLQLNNDPPVAFTSPGNAVALDVTSNLYLGGAPQLSSVNPRAVEDVMSLRDYTGCISEAKVNNQVLVLTEVGAVSGRNIDNCATQGAVA
ncbi:protein eyes shut homolog [Nematostella vectensis]|uniref:protein eyes shut homolog n=1 Tax=Nematostella vectensis TaxID=45351 RepID=UPI00207736F5|nr:protein eyes shut homolog [Nematostella vectensis]